MSPDLTFKEKVSPFERIYRDVCLQWKWGHKERSNSWMTFYYVTANHYQYFNMQNVAIDTDNSLNITRQLDPSSVCVCVCMCVFCNLFFNFTILYWFCHTSTCIRHRCTRVPHPEPFSLLPPHTMPLGKVIFFKLFLKIVLKKYFLKWLLLFNKLS